MLKGGEVCVIGRYTDEYTGYYCFLTGAADREKKQEPVKSSCFFSMLILIPRNISSGICIKIVVLFDQLGEMIGVSLSLSGNCGSSPWNTVQPVRLKSLMKSPRLLAQRMV